MTIIVWWHAPCFLHNSPHPSRCKSYKRSHRQNESMIQGRPFRWPAPLPSPAGSKETERKADRHGPCIAGVPHPPSPWQRAWQMTSIQRKWFEMAEDTYRYRSWLLKVLSFRYGIFRMILDQLSRIVISIKSQDMRVSCEISTYIHENPCTPAKKWNSFIFPIPASVPHCCYGILP